MKQFLLNLDKFRRTVVLAAFYSVVVMASFYLAYELRFDFVTPVEFAQERLRLVLLVVGIKLILLVVVGQLGVVPSYFSLPDLFRVIFGMTVASVLLFGAWWFAGQGYAPPRGVILTDYVLSVGGLCGMRLMARIYRERISVTRYPRSAQEQRIAIVGAGDVGASLAKEFLNMPSRGMRPVVFFDDDPHRHGQQVHGVPVIGGPELVEKARLAYNFERVVIAMPSAPHKRIQEVIRLMASVGFKVELVPALEDLSTGRVRVTRIRPVEVEDLLGREPVTLDSEGIHKLIAEKTVLVTGAGGSIGSELCRQIAALHPTRLLMVEQAEGNLFIIEQELNEDGFGAMVLPLVADILDQTRMEFIFQRFKPQIVFHAAAHKHVFMMERQPGEAIKNNSIGTRSLAQIAARAGTEAFVLISTDKAVNPTSVMGATKRLAELHLQALQAQADVRTKFIAVRFGNVLGSSGSVIPIFRRQIANGGPVTVTHPDVTRYFMTIPEAVGLVLQSTVLGNGGEIFVLDMGQPIKIIDLARQMIELSGFKPGDDIEIRFTGLRPGEKLFEELQHANEQHIATEHPRIARFVTAQASLDKSETMICALEGRLHELESNELKLALKKLVPEYTPHLD